MKTEYRQQERRYIRMMNLAMAGIVIGVLTIFGNTLYDSIRKKPKTEQPVTFLQDLKRNPIATGGLSLIVGSG